MCLIALIKYLLILENNNVYHTRRISDRLDKENLDLIVLDEDKIIAQGKVLIIRKRK